MKDAPGTKLYWIIYGVFSVPLLCAVVSSVIQNNWAGAALWGMTLVTVGAGVSVGYLRHKAEHQRLKAEIEGLLQRQGNV